MIETLYKHTCDMDGCWINHIGHDTTIPLGWKTSEHGQDHEVFCSGHCQRRFDKQREQPWHGGLELVVPWAYVLSQGTVSMAILWCAARNLPPGVSVDCDNGTACRVAKEGRTPHSIIRLGCPTFAEACEHPTTFVSAAKAAAELHQEKSDLGAWVVVGKRLRELSAAIDLLPEC